MVFFELGFGSLPFALGREEISGVGHVTRGRR